ncbi:SDR family NAD(P)-dependent oxidoreductase, partial [Roseibium sp.]
MADRLSGKRILITGAAQGIGLAIVRACLGEGAAVVLMDRDAALLARSVADLGGEAEYLTALAGDITNTDDVAAVVVRAQETIGPLNALINNAGINVFDEPLSLSDEDWNRCFDVNLKGAWNCARAVLPGLLEQGGGVILNIASTHAFT